MLLVFVHGWSVTSTDTYGGLPQALAAEAAAHGLQIDVVDLWLGRYISFHDEVTMADVVRAFEHALRATLTPDGGPLPSFACITHSTGGPVVREWIQRHYGAGDQAADRLDELPLSHLVMLAPANHGSPLAALGKERVGRIKAWVNGVQPGQRILDWLCLGSADQRRLSRQWLEYDGPAKGFYPFVLAGQTIDSKLYDFLNSYLVEVGSDGVVRVAGANLNYTMLTLTETDQTVGNIHFEGDAFVLSPDGGPRRPKRPVALGVLPQASHSGETIGIMRSVLPDNATQKPVVTEILNPDFPDNLAVS